MTRACYDATTRGFPRHLWPLRLEGKFSSKVNIYATWSKVWVHGKATLLLQNSGLGRCLVRNRRKAQHGGHGKSVSVSRLMLAAPNSVQISADLRLVVCYKSLMSVLFYVGRRIVSLRSLLSGSVFELTSAGVSKT